MSIRRVFATLISSMNLLIILPLLLQHKMIHENHSFADAFGSTIEEVNCSAIQQKKLLNSTLAAWKTVVSNAIHPLKEYRLITLVAVVTMVSISFLSVNNPESLNKWFSIGLKFMLIAPVILCFFDGKFKPYRHSAFMSAVVGLYLLMEIIASLKTFVIDNLITPEPLVQIIYFSLVFFIALTGYGMVYKTYQKVKNYAIR